MIIIFQSYKYLFDITKLYYMKMKNISRSCKIYLYYKYIDNKKNDQMCFMSLLFSNEEIIEFFIFIFSA